MTRALVDERARLLRERDAIRAELAAVERMLAAFAADTDTDTDAQRPTPRVWGAPAYR